MIDLQDQSVCPTLDDLGRYVGNPLFGKFCREMKEKYNCREKIEFSACSWERGWNLKYKKSGKNLCTIYPRESFFTVLVVVGKKEKEAVESVLPDCCAQIRGIYRETREGNGQKWLMIDLEDEDAVYRDALRLIEIRKGK